MFLSYFACLASLVLPFAASVPLSSSTSTIERDVDNSTLPPSSSSSSLLQYSPREANCFDVEIPLSVEVDGLEWIGPRWTDNYGLIDFIATYASRRSYNLTQLFQNATVGGDYTISGTVCVPKDIGDRASTVLLASHGLWYDRNYWSIPIAPTTHNFADRAIAQGYSLFLYDGLGVGESANQISGFDNQLLIQVDILRQLVGQVRSGDLTSDYLSSVDKTVLIGHAFGSVMSAQLLQLYPDLADAVILENLALALNGAVTNEAIGPRIAASQVPDRFADYDPGYLTWVDPIAAANTNFKLGYYTQETLNWLWDNGTPYSIVADFTQVPVGNVNATEFAGPTLVINGEFASTVCSGYCPGVTEDPLKGFGPLPIPSRLPSSTAVRIHYTSAQRRRRFTIRFSISCPVLASNDRPRMQACSYL